MNSRVNVPRPSGSNRYQAPTIRTGRSQHSLTHSHKTMFDAGKLIPYFVKPVMPGETLTVDMLAFLRVWSPLDAPIMDDISCSIDFFFVPSRLVWENHEYFLGAHNQAGAQDVDFTIPISAGSTNVEYNSPAGYMGVPIGTDFSATNVQMLPFRCYRLIYNEWYRDQNLINELNVPTDDGPDSADWGAATALETSAKVHDYFSSALPYLQKGDPVGVSLGTTAPVSIDPATAANQPVTILHGAGDYRLLDSNAANVDLSATTGASANLLYADLASATSISINALREAAAIQRLLERDARGGTRHPELIRAHFGVDVPDFRTQRPEYLGGGSGFINVSPIANTSATASEDQGQLAGTAAGTLRAKFAKSFVEFGYVLGILRARGQLSYQQGLDRFWSWSTKYDLPWPDLANLGEQPIYNREIYVDGTSGEDDVFGYQERYAEWRFKKSLITGKLNSAATGSLDFWHLAEDFASAPSLNATFIEDATPMARITTVTSEPDFIIDGRFDTRSAIPLPVRPTPSLAPARF